MPMSRKLERITTVTPTSSELYPVVHDLTEAEYGNGMCGCSRIIGAGAMLGNFSIEELARPNLHARPLSHHNSSTTCLPSDISNNNKERKRQRHSRTSSLLQVVSSHFSFGGSSTCLSSSEEAVSNDSTEQLDEEDEPPPTLYSFDDVFVLTRQIYRCKISTVWECVHRQEGTRHVVKMIDKRRFTCPADQDSAQREMAMLTVLQPYQSRYVPRLLMITENEYQYCVVMDYVQGGNLSVLRQGRHHLPEHHVQAIARSLLLGVAELHRLGIAHWNLCPENILLDPNLRDIVLCDFGCAWDMGHNNGYSMNWGGASGHRSRVDCRTRTRTGIPRCGSIHYAAPELLGSEKEFGLTADMWSVGVILYQLLCGRLPFEDVSKRALKEKIASGKFKFHGKEWHNISRGAKQFLSSLLHPDPQIRMTVGEALSHSWMAQPPQRSKDNNFLTRDACRKPTCPVVENGKRQGGFVKRLWGNWRSSSNSESLPSTATPLKSQVELLLLSELNHASTLSIDSDSKVSQSMSSLDVAHKISGRQYTLPIPLDYYRRLGPRR